jgi:energy-coupling factor transport system permease protein
MTTTAPRLVGDPAPTSSARRQRLPRALHPLAWWVWALALGAVASATTNPLLLGLILAVLALVVTNRRTDAPWARAFRYYLAVALVCIGIRVLFRTLFGTTGAPGDHVLFTLPVLHAPHWYAGVQLGGPVSLEGLLSASTDGLRLGTLLCCVGAANVLANPKRALRLLPAALYELGVAVVVAVSAAPQLVESVQRVHRARKLRGGGTNRRALRSLVIPVLEDALERSLRLAAAMDSRGYGRHVDQDRSGRRLTTGLLTAGVAGLCLGTYGLLDATSPRVIGLPMLGVGGVLCVTGLLLGGRRVKRTRYRPDPWLGAEWAVVALALAALATSVFARGATAVALYPSFSPLQWPQLPVLPTLGVLAGGLAAVVAPPPPRST